MPNDSLRVIAAMARKGGSGKTTLSRALISAAIAAGRRVTLMDTDGTDALGAWYERAEGAGYSSPLLTRTMALSVGAIEQEIDRIYDENLADLIFIGLTAGFFAATVAMVLALTRL